MKSFSYRSYSSQYYRPQPLITDDLEKSFLCIATPWGSKSAAEKCSELVHNYYLSSMGDQEATSPFERLSCLSKEANDLRLAVLYANEKIYSNENSNEYLSGCELLTITQTGNEVHLVQIGQPAIYLSRPGLPPLPMACHMDMSMNFSTGQHLLSPLPTQLLGVENHIDFSVISFIPQTRDKLIFISRTFAPASFLNMDYNQCDLSYLTKIISHENTQNPFWLGFLEF